ncbi:MAG: glycosyltransferase [Chlamydiota bacterium]|jgi:cellulose synthase/poly-beta-1,6-N-acetylglucosamine synthase-like glycosyltransferase
MNENILLGIDLFILGYFLLLNGFYILLLIFTNPNLVRRSQEVKAQDSYQLLKLDVVPPITIIIPTFNESEVLLSSVAAALNVDFPHIKVIVVDDDSTDQTMQLLMNNYTLDSFPPVFRPILKTEPIKHYYRSQTHPNLTVIHKTNGGREDSINAGINACMTPFFINIDADSIIEPDAVHRFAQHLFTEKNICAMGGMLTILNGCTLEKGRVTKVKLPSSFWGSMQVIEYLKTFFFARLGWNQLSGAPIISGGFGLFNKQAVVDIGGFQKVLAGDLDMTVALHKDMRDKKKPYRIDYVFDSIVWTDVPQTFSSLAKQRKRWHCSIVEVCWRRRNMMFNPKYGKVGFIHFPFLFFGEALAPLIEGFGYLYITFCFFYGVLNLTFFWYFILIAWGTSLFLTITSMIMQEIFLRKYQSIGMISKMFFFSLLDNFTYRPITVWWRIAGFFRFFTKNRDVYKRGERVSQEKK